MRSFLWALAGVAIANQEIQTQKVVKVAKPTKDQAKPAKKAPADPAASQKRKDYQAVHATRNTGEYLQTGTQGTISLLEYGNSLQEVWNIQADCSNVQIVSDLFDIEANWDYLYINGESYTGVMTIATNVSSPFTVMFTSDGSVNAPGFTLNWFCTELSGTSGTIGLDGYGMSQTLEWNIQSSCSGLHLYSSMFNLETGWDTLVIEGQEYTGEDAIDLEIESANVNIVFNSDSSVAWEGFTLHWECTIIGTTPAGILTGNSGTIILSTQSYEDSLELQWEIQSGCEIVHIFSEEFNVETNFDNLYIDGVAFTGTDPISATGGTNVVLFFISDSSVTYDGFILHWECQSNTTPPGVLTGTSGTIVLSTQSYGNNADLQWDIQSDCQSVHIFSDLFSLEHSYDNLHIDEVAYTGSDPINVSGLGANVVVLFTSDGSVTYDGFVLQWACDSQSTPAGILTGTSGTIVLDGYVNNQMIQWDIHSDCQEVYIYSSEFHLESNFDYLHIDGVTYTGTEPIDVYRPSNVVVVFTSDGSVTQDGFVLHWECSVIATIPTPSLTTPAGILTGSSGSIILDGYSNDENIEWEIQTDCDAVHIYSSEFDLEDGYDNVHIDGVAYTGVDAVSAYGGPQVTVLFTSDYSVTHDGFVLHWECTSNTTPAGTLTGTAGTIILSGLSYGTDQEIQWDIQSDCQAVQIDSEEFHLESSFDYLYIDGVAYSGSDPVSVLAGANVVVLFTSDGSVTYDGFILNWACSTPPQPTTAPTTTEIPAPDLTGTQGTIILDGYGNSQTTEWNIQSDCDNVHIYSEEFHLEHNFDHLTIDGVSYTGSEPISVNGGQNVQLIFTSDGSITTDGFVLHWECTSNTTPSGTLTGTAGTIILSGLSYGTDQEIQWDIQSDCQAVQIDSEEFHLESSFDYLYIDGVAYSGSDPVSVLAGANVVVLFTSDGSVTYDGFILNWACSTPPQPTTAPTTATTDTTATQDVLTGTAGTISLNGYDDDENIQWSIQSDCDQVHIYSSWFSLENNYDFLYVEDESYTGSGPVFFYVQGANVNVQFVSDYSITADGFLLNWECSDVVITTQSPSFDQIMPGTRCTAGNPFSSTKIINGVEAVPQSWPWIASLQVDESFHFCAGSIINSQWIVSAAHCCSGSSPAQITAVIGQHDISVTSGHEQRVQVLRIIMHPNYGLGDHSITNDICLLQTTEMDLDMSTRDVVCLPSQGDHIGPDDTDAVGPNACFIAGWGTDENGQSPNKLHSARLNIFSAPYCEQNAPQLGIDDDVEFCAGYLSGDRDTCQGDSGGPLVCVVDTQPVLYGITSWGYGCGDPNSPGLYTMVANYIDWIGEAMNSEPPTQPPPVTQTGTSGTIVLDGYENNAELTWAIESDCDSVYLHSSEFHIEHGWDHLMIDGVSYTGSDPISVEGGPNMVLVFTSDGSITTDGFVLQWQCTPHTTITPPSTTPAPPVIQTGTSGTIELAGYDNNAELTWLIQSDCEDVYLYSSEFHLEHGWDHLTIDGISFTGSDPISIEGGSHMELVFTSDGSVTTDGFILYWECSASNPEHIMTGTSGTIAMEGYVDNLDITWLIQSDCENVHIVSEYFHLENNYDNLYIDGVGFTGSENIDVVGGESMTVQFTSDISITADGFVLHWACSVTTTWSHTTTTPTTGSTTWPEQPPVNPPNPNECLGEYNLADTSVSCGSSGFAISTPVCAFVTNNLDVSTAGAAGTGEGCNAHVTDNMLHFNLPAANLCGTTISNNGSHLIYSNTIHANGGQPEGRSITRHRSMEMMFSCAMQIERTVSMSTGLSSTTLTEVNLGTHSGVFDILMGLYTDSSFTTQVPANFATIVPNLLYVSVELESATDELVMQGRRCWATPSTDPDDETNYVFLDDFCSTEDAAALQVIQNGDANAFQFALESFAFAADAHAEIYLHCIVHTCDDDLEDCNADCSNNVRKRRRRGTSQSSTAVRLGPIMVQQRSAIPASGL